MTMATFGCEDGAGNKSKRLISVALSGSRRTGKSQTNPGPFSPSSSCSSLASSTTGEHLAETSSKSHRPLQHVAAPSARPSVPRPRKKQDDTPAITKALYSCLNWFFPSSTMPKIPLEKGYSQMDWLRLTQVNKNLNGLNGAPLRDDITMAEVRKHCTREDAWMVFNGMVYNITPYLRFHPGGAEILLKVAGKDGTSLFMKYHAWVNIGALMSKCLVGRLAIDPIQAQAAADIQQAKSQRQYAGQPPTAQGAHVSMSEPVESQVAGKPSQAVASSTLAEEHADAPEAQNESISSSCAQGSAVA